MLQDQGFDEKTLEKIYRICDILQRVSQVPYTKNRLCLYGGTALNFVHFKNIPRLSIDIDYNYRLQDDTKDWGKDREKIDEIIKQILTDLRYSSKAINIQASYPLTRFTLHYTTEQNQKDTIKIEIGYMRRMPVLKNDQTLTFNHIKTQQKIKITTPQSEELYANKFCTLLYRYNDQETISSRDLYDVYTIQKQTFNQQKFQNAMVLDSLMRPKPKLYQQKPKTIIENITLDNYLLPLLHNRQIPKDLKEKTTAFIQKNLKQVHNEYKEIIDLFFDKANFDPTLFKSHDQLNPNISSHPSIQWNLKKQKNES